ncbi:hypothetical protein BGZ73_005987 [Actinomortierella ambigua]|nr:hypothetical protein BGZ73_005987 [Actinomortierella ambigua]
MLLNLSPLVVLATALALQAAAIPVPEDHYGHGYQASRIKNVVVFGDSYSDNGNVYNLTNKAWPFAFNYKGRFTNGPNWADNVARDARVKLYDLAYGGATTDSEFIQGYSGEKGDVPVPGFFQQIEERFVPLAFSPKTLASTLLIVDFQGNDFLFSSTVTPEDVVARLERGIHRLIGLGARNILIVGNHNFGLVPYFASQPATAESFSKMAKHEQQLIHQLTVKLHKQFGVPSPRHPFRQCDANLGRPHKSRVRIALFDQLAFFEYLYQPKVLKRLGIKDVKGQCETADYRAVCDNPEDYFYWDSFHATAKVHRALASAILEFI